MAFKPFYSIIMCIFQTCSASRIQSEQSLTPRHLYQGKVRCFSSTDLRQSRDVRIKTLRCKVNPRTEITNLKRFFNLLQSFLVY